jgi:hypothetical protein
MTAAFGSSSNTTYASRSALTVTAPSGIADGDFLLALILWSGSGNTITPPAGWAQVGSTASASDGSFTVNSGVFTKVAASESGDYTWTPGATAATQGLILRYTGANGAVNTSSSNMVGVDAGNQDRDANSITPSVDGCMLVYAGFDWGDYTTDLTPPTGYTERVEVNPLIYAADALQVTAGATGTVTMQCNASVIDPRGAWLIALEPAATGSIGSGDGTATGTATAASVGRATAASAGSAAGGTTAAGAGTALKRAAGTAAGVGSAAATARPRAATVGSAAGSSTAAGSSSAAGTGVASATGSATAAAGGASRVARAVSAAGTSVAAATGFMAGTVSAVASAAGIGRANGIYGVSNTADRILRVPAESRSLSVAAEQRTLQVE